MAPPEFKPGMFEPVITIGQRPDGNTRAFHGDKDGLIECSKATFSVAHSTASGHGANMDLSRASVAKLSKIIGHFLWARNLANQLNKANVNQGFNRELARELELPEPIVKLFNAYGHFEHDMSTHVQLDLEREFSMSLIDLVYSAKDTNLDDEDIVVHDPPEHDTLSGVGLSPSGDVIIDNRTSVSEHVNTLVTYIMGLQITAEKKLRFTKSIIDVATERDLATVIRWLNMQDDIGTLPQRPVNNRNPNIAYIREAIGDQDDTHGATISKRELLRSIRRATDMMRSLVDELSILIAPVPIPKYEQGSAAQTAETIEDITFSHFPISLADATVCAAFNVGKATRRFLRAAPEDVGPGLAQELIRKSVRRRA